MTTPAGKVPTCPPRTSGLDSISNLIWSRLGEPAELLRFAEILELFRDLLGFKSFTDSWHMEPV